MDKFDAMQMFVRAIEKGSFSAVAKERGIGQPAVSKQISALEDELGTELIHRTSRSIALTEAGRDFYESSLRILDDFENATSRIRRGQTAPKGLIRVTVAPTLARLHRCQSCLLFLLLTRRWPWRWRHRRARQRSSKTGLIWLSTQVIFQIPLWLLEGLRRRRPFSSPLPNTSHGSAHRNRRKNSIAFDRSCLSSVAPYGHGALAPDETRSVLSPQESFEPATLNRCGWVSLNIWGLPRRQPGSSPQNSERVPLSAF